MGAVTAVSAAAGLLVAASADRPMEGALGSQPRGVGAPREDGSLALPERHASAGREGSVTEGVSGTFIRLGRCRTSTPRVLRRATRGSPLGEDERSRSERLRRTIAPLPGAGGAGNSIPASATSSPLSARVSARVMGQWAKRRSTSRKRRARESRGRWVLVATSRLQRSQMSISRSLVGAFGCPKGGASEFA